MTPKIYLYRRGVCNTSCKSAIYPVELMALR